MGRLKLNVNMKVNLEISSPIEGYAIRVNAECNQGGSITKQLTVGSGETPISEDEDDGGSTPGFEFLILMISLILIVFILRKRR